MEKREAVVMRSFVAESKGRVWSSRCVASGADAPPLPLVVAASLCRSLSLTPAHTP